jgi:hypothetical protein
MSSGLPNLHVTSLNREDGFALPTVLLMLTAAFAIASVAVIGSINSQHQTSRDLDTKDALGIAEAGAQQALVRYNAAGAKNTCVSPEALGPDGWCTPVTATVGGGTFTYWVKPGSGSIDIVAQATQDGVTRRVNVTAHSASASQPFTDAGVIGRDSIFLNSNADITANAATNGDIGFANGASSFLCGNAQVGVGHLIGKPPTCGGQVTQGEVILPVVDQGDVRTNNANSKFFSLSPSTGQKSDICWNGATPSGAASSQCGSREMYIGVQSQVTLASGNYSFCRLQLNQHSSLAIASGAVVRIYFDSPEACGYASPANQLLMEQNSSIVVNGTSGASDVALLFVGSETRTTTIQLSSNTSTPQTCSQHFVVYAPRTQVNLASNSYYCGAIAGKSISLASNAHITASNLAQDFELPNAPAHYTVDRFVECPITDTSGGC